MSAPVTYHVQLGMMRWLVDPSKKVRIPAVEDTHDAVMRKVCCPDDARRYVANAVSLPAFRIHELVVRPATEDDFRLFAWMRPVIGEQLSLL